MSLAGELVINLAMLSQSLERAGLSPHSDAMNGLEEFHRLTRDIQDSVMMIRAQSVKSLFQRMRRIVRESSSAVGKDVRLITEGENTEVDKTVIERLSGPLTHMIRRGVMSIRGRGAFVPVFDLGAALGCREPVEDTSGCVVLLTAQEDGQRAAIMTDDIRDQRQVGIRGLDENFYRAPGIAAATILGDGRIALILDPTECRRSSPAA